MMNALPFGRDTNQPKPAKAFPTSQAVSEALRGLLALADETARITGRSKRIARKRAAV